MRKNLKLTVLSAEEKDVIHEATLELLSNIGVKVEGNKALNLLTKAGCSKSSRGLITVPAGLVEYALKLLREK